MCKFALRLGLFAFVVGCALYALHNLCMEDKGTCYEGRRLVERVYCHQDQHRTLASENVRCMQIGEGPKGILPHPIHKNPMVHMVTTT